VHKLCEKKVVTSCLPPQVESTEESDVKKKLQQQIEEANKVLELV
jgi:hypothetical protein